MKKNLIRSIITAFLMCSAISCTDILDQKPDTDFNEENIWQNIELARSFLGSCYDNIGGHPNYGLGMREDLLASCTDELLNIHRPFNMVFLKVTLRPGFLGYFGNTAYGGFLNWEALYSNIQNINKFIANIDKVPDKISTDESLKTGMKGEAYFLRAYDYSQLLFGYGGVVLSDKPFELNQDFNSIIRSNLNETRDFILEDIDKAIELLPKKGETEQGRATRGAAAALKSRLLLFCASKLVNGGYNPEDTLVSFTTGTQTERWLAARDAAKAIIDGTYGSYSLSGTTNDPPSPLTEPDVQSYSDNYSNIFTQKGTWNNETIWGIQYVSSGGSLNKANLWNGPFGYHNWGNNEPTEPAVRSFEMADGTPFQWDKYNPGNHYIRTATATELVTDPEKNPYINREPRFYASILYDGAKWQARPSDVIKYDPIGIIQTWNKFSTDGKIIAAGLDTRQASLYSWSMAISGYYLKKFMDVNVQGESQNNSNTWVEFRYAEVLLNYAEASIELGGAGIQIGLDILNIVRNRAGLPDRVTTDQATARDFLRHERAIEFFAEGHRWYDIRRWMIAESVIGHVRQMKIKKYEDGNMVWELDQNSVLDDRVFAIRNYWLPIPATETAKAPQIRNNPGY